MITPSGFLSTPVASMRAMLAASPAFRTWVGAADADEALAHIYAIAAPRHEVLPMALIEVGEHVRQRSLVAGRYAFENGPGSHLVVSFRMDADGAEEPDAGYAFLNALGAIIVDVEKASGNQSAGIFTIPAISIAAPPQRIRAANRQSVGDYYEAAFIIQQGFRS
jgi:hypothetical protein